MEEVVDIVEVFPRKILVLAVLKNGFKGYAVTRKYSKVWVYVID